MPAIPYNAEPNMILPPGDFECEPLIPGWLGRAAIEGIEKIHASFLKTAGTEMSELLQTQVPMTFRKARQIPFSAIRSETGERDHVIVFDLAPVRGRGYLVFSSLLLFRVLDILLATTEDPSMDSLFGDPTRAVTGIELYILREFFDIFTRVLRDTWEPHYPLEFRPIPAEDESDPYAAESSDSLSLNLISNIDIGGVSGEIRLVFPALFARQLHLRAAISECAPNASVPRRGEVLQSLAEAIVRVDATMAGNSIRIRTLLDMVPGQILALGTSESSPVECLVNDVRQFRGEILASRGRYALHIDSLIDQTLGQ